jgi:hypothetical protein
MDDVDVVPLFARGGDPLEGWCVTVAQIVEGLVRKNDAPAEGVVWAVTLDHRHGVRRILLLHEERKVEARRAAAEDGYLHVSSTADPSARR